MKPTHLLCLRTPSLRERLDAEVDPTWRPGPSPIGKNEKGEWKTAALKEYPERMCKALA